MIPHNMTLFKFICVQYQFHRQTLPIMKIDRGQIQFRDYVSTGTEPMVKTGYLYKEFIRNSLGTENIIGIARLSDKTGIGLDRFHCTSHLPFGQTP